MPPTELSAEAPLTLTSWRKRLGTLLVGLAISALFIWLTLRKTDLDRVWTTILSVQLLPIGVILANKSLGFFFLTLRSRLMASAVAEAGSARLLRSILVSYVGNNVLPFRLGDLLRVSYLSAHLGRSPAAWLAMVGFERLTDALCLVLVFGLSVPTLLGVMPARLSFWLLAALVPIALATTLWTSRHPDRLIAWATALTGLLGERASAVVVPRLERFAGGLAALASTRTVLGVLLATFGYWFTSFLSISLWLWAFRVELPWYAPILVLAFVGLGSALPASPGFVGTYHYFVVLALTTQGVDRELSTSVAIFGHALAIVPFTLMALVLFLVDASRGDFRLRQRARAEPAPGGSRSGGGPDTQAPAPPVDDSDRGARSAPSASRGGEA